MNVFTTIFIFSFLSSGIYGLYDDVEELSTIEISTGLLRAGYRDLSHRGTTYTAFEGIPYARPPVGELRFQAPEEPYNWTGTWLANTRYSCIPFLHTAGYLKHPGSEDCLYLNVYVPKAHPSKDDNFDVVVHFHTGGFTIGHPHFASGPKYLMDNENLIYVSLNYRLGPLGFLSTGDEVLSGNNGLKDQVMALKWIQKNIKYFGGNPESVTITGSGAGGASVHYHYLSPMSKGLFHRGYSGSGTALDPWALQDQPLEKAKRLAALLGCNPAISQDILNCVMQRSTQAIFDATFMFYYEGMPFSPFGPVIEPKHEKAFLDQHPYQKLKAGNINDLPWIVVVNKHEGMFPSGAYYQNIEHINQDWNNFAPHLFDYNFTVPLSERDKVSQKIKNQYFGDKPVSFSKLVKACSDRHFFRGAELSAKLQQNKNKSPVYFLMFAYEGDFSFSFLFGIPVSDKGVSNGDDSLYYLSTSMHNHMANKDAEMKDIMVGVIASFAKTNVPKLPEIDWKPIEDGKLRYLYLDDYEGLETREREDLGSHAFWKTLGLKENENYFDSPKDEL